MGEGEGEKGKVGEREGRGEMSREREGGRNEERWGGGKRVREGERGTTGGLGRGRGRL